MCVVYKCNETTLYSANELIRPLQYRSPHYLMRAAMTTSRPQIAQSSEQLAVQTFAVQGRTVFHQRSRGRWQPEAFVAGKSSKISCGSSIVRYKPLLVQLEWVDTYADANSRPIVMLYAFVKSSVASVDVCACSWKTRTIVSLVRPSCPQDPRNLHHVFPSNV